MGFTRRQWNFLLILHLASGTFIMAFSPKPNFVLLLADDLGIGDIGCYGNATIRTPNIDNLANEGVQLTQHIAAAPLCTPSRAAFMTGRYPLRSGMESCGGARTIKWLGVPGGLPPNETTFAAILQKQGYSTGIIGKWHLGLNCESLNDHCHHPLSHGFDYFYGLPFTLINECQPGGLLEIDAPFVAQLTLITQLMAFAVMTLVIVRYSNMLTINRHVILYSALFCILFFITWYFKYGFIQYWSCIIMRNHEIIEQPMKVERTASQILKEAQQFIDRNQNAPFLLIVSFLHVHTPLVTTEAFTGKSKHGLYGDNVEEMDFMVGSVVDAIDNAGLKNSTMMYFASDHGGHLEVKYGKFQTGGWNGIYRGGKGMAGWEGGIRVPGIFRWPGVIPSNVKIDEPTSLMDIYPTVVFLGGGELPKDRFVLGDQFLFFNLVAQLQWVRPPSHMHILCPSEVRFLRTTNTDMHTPIVFNECAHLSGFSQGQCIRAKNTHTYPVQIFLTARTETHAAHRHTEDTQMTAECHQYDTYGNEFTGIKPAAVESPKLSAIHSHGC